MGACAPMPQPMAQLIPTPYSAAQPMYPQPMYPPQLQAMSAAMPQPQGMPQSHPMHDNQQQAYPYQDEFWADHLEYDVTPVGYQAEPTGTFSYYPSYFQ